MSAQASLKCKKSYFGHRASYTTVLQVAFEGRFVYTCVWRVAFKSSFPAVALLEVAGCCDFGFHRGAVFWNLVERSAGPVPETCLVGWSGIGRLGAWRARANATGPLISGIFPHVGSPGAVGSTWPKQCLLWDTSWPCSTLLPSLIPTTSPNQATLGLDHELHETLIRTLEDASAAHKPTST